MFDTLRTIGRVNFISVLCTFVIKVKKNILKIRKFMISNKSRVVYVRPWPWEGCYCWRSMARPWTCPESARARATKVGTSAVAMATNLVPTSPTPPYPPGVGPHPPIHPGLSCGRAPICRGTFHLIRCELCHLCLLCFWPFRWYFLVFTCWMEKILNGENSKKAFECHRFQKIFKGHIISCIIWKITKCNIRVHKLFYNI